MGKLIKAAETGSRNWQLQTTMESVDSSCQLKMEGALTEKYFLPDWEVAYLQ